MIRDSDKLIARWSPSTVKNKLDDLIRQLISGKQTNATWVDGAEEVEGARDLRGAPLSGRNLEMADLSDWNLDFADLHGALLRGASLARASLMETNLSEADLRECDLRGAMIIDSNLRNTDLRHADARHATFIGSDLTHAHREGANFNFANLDSDNSGADLDTGTVGSIDDSNLHSSIENLYQVFAQYHAPEHIDFSPLLSVAHEDAVALYRTPLRQIESQALWRYSFHALNTWGQNEDFKHFLPRMFDLLWLEPGWTESEILIAKLEQAEWSQWPAKEHDAVVKYLTELFHVLLSSFPSKIRIDEIIAGVAQLDGILTPFLRIWTDTKNLPATLHIASLINEEREALWRHGKIGKRYGGGRETLTQWITSESIEQRIEDTFMDNPHNPHSDILAAASDILVDTNKIHDLQPG